MNLAEKFWQRVEKGDDCWLWTGALKPTGYGTLSVSRKTYQAHRIAYELLVAPIPEGLQLDHLCRVRNCVNPEHLEPVTQTENIRRGQQGHGRTHCVHGHEYTPENTIVRKNGWRMCRTCHSAWGKDHYRRNRERIAERRRKVAAHDNAEGEGP